MENYDGEKHHEYTAIKREWKRQGGVRLELKELRYFETETALVLYNIFNEGSE